MSRPEPKFSVGEIVNVRYKQRPSLNRNFAKIEKLVFAPKGSLYIRDGVRDTVMDRDLWFYFINSHKNGLPEFALHPIPKEKPNGIDALEWIKDLRGVEA